MSKCPFSFLQSFLCRKLLAELSTHNLDQVTAGQVNSSARLRALRGTGGAILHPALANRAGQPNISRPVSKKSVGNLIRYE